jgi:hypothetical protein
MSPNQKVIADLCQKHTAAEIFLAEDMSIACIPYSLYKFTRQRAQLQFPNEFSCPATEVSAVHFLFTPENVFLGGLACFNTIDQLVCSISTGNGRTKIVTVSIGKKNRGYCVT